MTGTDAVVQAVLEGDAARLATLLREEPARAHARDAQGVSALLLALYRRREDMAALLRHAALDVFEAAALGDDARLQALLEKEPAQARTLSADGFTALHLAAFFGQPGAVQGLLQRGAEPGVAAQNAMRVQPLHAAVSGASLAVTELLLAAGALPDARQQGGWTPLHSAAQQGRVDLVRALLAAGADPRLTNDEGVTAAQLARDRGHTEVMELLVSA
ncbi:MAG: ankyrin repeat domain-containing protein [Myxococcaceae bacterium]|nr:ankyrin repeat domain-containing protein [Myxococcaceae bacterium]